MAQENAALGRLRPYRLRDCRVFGNMIHLPALWVLSNLLTSSICCSCSVTISRAGAWFHIPTPCTCTRASLEGKCRCVCSFPVFEKKTFFLQKKITAESIYHVYLLPSITSTAKRQYSDSDYYTAVNFEDFLSSWYHKYACTGLQGQQHLQFTFHRIWEKFHYLLTQNRHIQSETHTPLSYNVFESLVIYGAVFPNWRDHQQLWHDKTIKNEHSPNIEWFLHRRVITTVILPWKEEMIKKRLQTKWRNTDRQRRPELCKAASAKHCNSGGKFRRLLYKQSSH